MSTFTQNYRFTLWNRNLFGPVFQTFASSNRDGCTHTHTRQQQHHHQQTWPTPRKLYKLSTAQFQLFYYRFSTKWNPVLVLDWCWRQFTLRIRQEPGCFQRPELVREPRHYVTTSLCHYVTEALWGFVGIQTRRQIWDTNHQSKKTWPRLRWGCLIMSNRVSKRQPKHQKTGSKWSYHTRCEDFDLNI